jgi:hypothetical protein
MICHHIEEILGHGKNLEKLANKTNVDKPILDITNIINQLD